MGNFAELPTELILHIVSFLSREIIPYPTRPLPGTPRRQRQPRRVRKPELIPDLSSINAITQTNRVFHHTLNQTLYTLCASVESRGKRALLFAVEHDLEATFDNLVAAGVSIDEGNVLRIAANMGHQLIVSKLLGLYGEEMLTRVYARDGDTWSALDCAVYKGHTEIVRLLACPPVPGELIQLEAHKQYISRALLGFPRKADIAICEYLILQGADVNIRDIDHCTPLSYATINDDLALMQLLLAAGADPNRRTGYGDLPLFSVVSIPAAEVLLGAGGANIHATGMLARNALAYVSFKHVPLLRFFLERGVDPNHEDEMGETPLHHACKGAGAEEIELLLQFGAVTVEKADRYGVTPVFLALQTGKVEVVELLSPLVENPSLKSNIAMWLRKNSKKEERA
ncbi:ankyrin repeat-containing domain protein [Mycena sanguinolenta]|nr:ankyrin repeat-containing domain protein [Mycena sanguinolenta]